MEFAMKIYRPYVVSCLFGLFLFFGCAKTPVETNISPKAEYKPLFSYDGAAVPDAKPWTSENFRNNPDNFQFAIIGDRTGGANIEGTFALAMDQLNLVQPEFVINVGDLIEGYTEDRAELNAMWDEAEGLTGKLQMPFFYTIGNHDVSNPTMKEV
jgi:hypothetical protein